MLGRVAKGLDGRIKRERKGIRRKRVREGNEGGIVKGLEGRKHVERKRKGREINKG